ncbi:GNAT family N-acetyltransferase [Mucilaginibacter sp. UC70_90]
MDTTPVISSLNNTYCQQIIDIILPIQQIEFNVPITLEAQPDLLDIETNYHQTGGDFWGAIYNEQLVGTIALIAFDNNAAAIRKMFVLKEYRGKSWASRSYYLIILLIIVNATTLPTFI